MKQEPKFSQILDVAMESPPDDMTALDHDNRERDFGLAVLRRWVRVACWLLPDKEVADILEKEAAWVRNS